MRLSRFRHGSCWALAALALSVAGAAGAAADDKTATFAAINPPPVINDL